MADYAVSTAFRGLDFITKTMDNMGKSVEKFGNNASKHMDNASHHANLFKNILGGILGAEAVRSGLEMVKEATIGSIMEIAKLGEEATKTGKRIGISAEAYQELSFVAKKEAVDNETLVKSLQFLNKNIGQLQTGHGNLFSALRHTNPELLKQLYHVKDNEKAFNLAVNAIEKMPNPMRKAALAQAFFGKSGQAMLNVTTLGTEGIKKQREEARKFGGVMSNEASKSAMEFEDSVKNAEFAILGLKVAFASGVIPLLKPLVDKFAEWIGKNHDLIKLKFDYYIDKIGTGIKILTSFIGFLSDAFEALSPAIYTTIAAIVLYNAVLAVGKISSYISMIAWLGKEFIALATKQGVLTAAWEIFNLVVSANPLGLWITAIAAVIGLVLLLIKHWSTVVVWLEKAWNWFIKLGSVMNPYGSGGFQANNTNQFNQSPVEAPNKKESEAKANQIGFNGRLDINGLPKGSKFESKTTGANPIRTNVLSAPIYWDN